MAVCIVTTRKDAPGAWRDLAEGVDREPGTSFEAEQERAEQVKSLLPDYVDVKAKGARKKASAATTK